jgi:ABC-type nitrate/sulfonate/bicarbonate transport system ATPase subunit
MIDVQSLTYTYSGSTPVFQDFNWSVERGEAWAVLGPSGCGKTTLLYLLAGLLFPTRGRIVIDGQPLERPRPQTGLILQEYGLLPWATVAENASLGLRIRAFYGPDGKHSPLDFKPEGNVEYWLERLGLETLQDKYPSQISGGQRQRAAIARTLALEPDLLLMDEPYSSLDAPTREDLQALSLDLQVEANLTLVIVTHSIEEAAFMGRKILLLGNPPNIQATIFENPGEGQAGYRESSEYFALIRLLRLQMDQLST